MAQRGMHNRALTLIEILVVIAIIALLAALALPAKRLAKQAVAASICLSNQRQLTLAWQMYSDDFDGLLVGGSTYHTGKRPTPWRWVERPLFNDIDNPETEPVPTADQYSRDYRLNGIRAGRLFAYTENTGIYHCRADHTAFTLPEPWAAWRSYAIAGLMNGEDFVDREGGLYTPIANYAYINTANGPKTLVCVTRESQIVSPGEKYVFVEESVAGRERYNAGSFVLMEGAIQTSWWNRPAAFHLGSGTFGFADGHADKRKWKDPRTLELIADEGSTVQNNQPNNADLEWMIRGYLPCP